MTGRRRSPVEASREISTELDFRRQVVDLATLAGWDHVGFRAARTTFGWRVPGTGTMAQGWPDLTLVRGTRLIFAELKSDTGRVAPAQVEVLALLAAVAETYVWRPDDLPQIARVLGLTPAVDGQVPIFDDDELEARR